MAQRNEATNPPPAPLQTRLVAAGGGGVRRKPSQSQADPHATAKWLVERCGFRL